MSYLFEKCLNFIYGILSIDIIYSIKNRFNFDKTGERISVNQGTYMCQLRQDK